jgi:hypothetical protein
MSRAALLPFPGDPFLLNYWMKCFELFWQDEVDAVYILHNSGMQSDVRNYIKRRALSHPKVHFIDHNRQIEHGEALNTMLDQCAETHVMLIEDDGFIFRKGVVNAAFEAIETHKKLIIGSKRGSCSQEILDRAAEIWGLSYEGYGDQGCNFWPNFFFTEKEVLKKSDRHFGAKAWHKGQEIFYLSRPGDPYFVKEDIAASDTFVNTSLQLRATYPENLIHYVPQYHGSPNDIDDFDANRNLFDGHAPWCHIGSLSSGVGGILMDEDGRPLSRRLVDDQKGLQLPVINSEGERLEFERRVQWFLTFYENRQAGEIDEFAEIYRQAIDRLIKHFSINIKSLRRRQSAYRWLGLP